MDYLKNLTIKQWLIILGVLVLFLALYLFFTKKTPVNQKIDLQKLINQGTAPATSADNIGRDKLEKFLKSNAGQSGATSTVKGLSSDQKNALFKLMSVPTLK